MAFRQFNANAKHIFKKEISNPKAQTNGKENRNNHYHNLLPSNRWAGK